MVTTVPVVEQLPTAPNRGMSSTTYPIIADAWAAKIGPWTTQVNVVTVWIGVQIDLALEYKNAAAQSATDAAAAADRAEAVDTNVSEQVLAAQTAAANAQAAAAAAGAAAGLPAMVGHAGHALVVNDDEQTVSFVNLAPKRWAAVLSM